MQTKAARMRDIEKADRARREAREMAEMAPFRDKLNLSPIDPTVDGYLFARSINGAPSNKMRQQKATQSSWNRGLKGRTFGVADYGQAGNTVKVISTDGSVTIRNSSDFRKTNIHKAQRANVIAEAPKRRIMANDPRFGSKHIG